MASGVYLVVTQAATPFFYVMVALSLVFGLLLVIPIGAADMPVVIALLNSYGGLADAAMGFVLMNKIQIITGSLDGTSGFLLALLMCRAMNRSAMNVLFGAFGKVSEEDVDGRRRGEGHRAQHRAPRRRPCSSRPRTTSSSCPATAWPWRRRSTRWPSSATS